MSPITYTPTAHKAQRTQALNAMLAAHRARLSLIDHQAKTAGDALAALKLFAIVFIVLMVNI